MPRIPATATTPPTTARVSARFRACGASTGLPNAASFAAICSAPKRPSAPLLPTSSTPRNDPARNFRSCSTASATSLNRLERCTIVRPRCNPSATSPTISAHNKNGSTRGNDNHRAPPIQMIPTATATATSAITPAVTVVLVSRASPRRSRSTIS
ncbi:MAG: hypothetical protein U0132_09700 [Gemmatimonadaceae bacterium]